MRQELDKTEDHLRKDWYAVGNRFSPSEEERMSVMVPQCSFIRIEPTTTRRWKLSPRPSDSFRLDTVYKLLSLHAFRPLYGDAYKRYIKTALGS